MDRIDHIAACFRYASLRTPTGMFLAQWHRWRSARLKLARANRTGGRGPAMALINRTGRKMGEAYRRHKVARSVGKSIVITMDYNAHPSAWMYGSSFDPAPLTFSELMADFTVLDEQEILRGMPWTG